MAFAGAAAGTGGAGMSEAFWMHATDSSDMALPPFRAGASFSWRVARSVWAEGSSNRIVL